LVGPIGFLWK